MMQFIRKNIKLVGGVIIFVVAAFIGTIFLVWGRGGPSDDGRDVAAYIGEEPVYRTEYNALYNNLLDFYQSVYQDVPAGEIERRFNLAKVALDSLLDRRVLLVEAGRRGIEVSDQEVAERIMANPAFQVGGQFDRSRYLLAVRSIRQSPEQFERSQRNDLILKKMETVIREGVKVTDAEALDDFRRAKEELTVRYVLVPTTKYEPKAKPSEEEIGAFFESHRQDYFQPERIRAVFAAVDPAALAREAVLGEEAIADYYEDNREQFFQPEQVRARHILLRVDEDASPERVEEVRKRAEFVLEKARGGADFAVLAKEFSQDGSGPEGGDLGFFSRETMVPEFSEAAFELEPGEVSDLVRTQYGFHVVKVEDRREEREKTFEEARAEVEARLRREAGQMSARDLAERFNDELYDRSLDEVAEELGFKVQETDLFAVSESAGAVPFSIEVKEALFRLNVDEVSEEIQFGGKRYFFQLKERREGHLPDLEEVRGKVTADLTKQKAAEQARQEADRVRVRVDAGESLAEAGFGHVTGTAGPFSRASFVTEFGTTGEALAPMFEAETGKVTGPLAVSLGFVVSVPDEKSQIDMAGFEAQKEEIRSRLWQEKSDRFLQAWIEEAHQRLGVRIVAEDLAAL